MRGRNVQQDGPSIPPTTPENEAARQANVESGKDISPGSGEESYREMTIAQKLNRADELLKQYEGTDKYDAFKKRVDAMKHKYGEIARIAPDAKWNYDEASQAGGQKGLPDLQPNVQIAGSSIIPDYDSTIAKRQNYLDWYSKRGWGSRFVSKLSGQNKQLADTAERAKDDIAYLKGMKNALGYAVANPERARALGALVTPRQFFSDGSPRANPTSFVWNENLGQFSIVPREIKIKPREPAQGVRQDAKGGNASGPETPVSETPVSETAPAPQGGPRIVINPAVFKDKRDALCVCVNEAFRIIMEDTGFEPVSEPTEAQRRFFSDTAYADDELQMRRTILARICTFDTSVKDPTDEQLQESVEFLHSVLEAGYPQNEWEQALVQKLLDILSHVPTGRRGGTSEPEPSAGGGLETQGDVAGGIAGNVEREEERDLKAGGAVLENPKYDTQGVAAGPQQDADVPLTVERQNENNLRAGGAVLADPRHDAEGAEFDAERRRERQDV